MQINEFLNSVCEQIKYKPIRSTIAEELKNHIEDKKEELKVQDKLKEKIDNNVKDEVHMTKQDYLNRLNALKSKK